MLQLQQQSLKNNMQLNKCAARCKKYLSFKILILQVEYFLYTFKQMVFIQDTEVYQSIIYHKTGFKSL